MYRGDDAMIVRMEMKIHKDSVPEELNWSKSDPDSPRDEWSSFLIAYTSTDPKLLEIVETFGPQVIRRWFLIFDEICNLEDRDVEFLIHGDSLDLEGTKDQIITMARHMMEGSDWHTM
jgi:hypothetical protein